MLANIWTDGGCRGNPGPAGCGIVIEFPNGKKIRHGFKIGEATNNVAEYAAVEMALALATNAGATDIVLYSDSKLVVEQLMGRWKIKDKVLRGFVSRIAKLRESLRHFLAVHIPRAQNDEADQLVNDALDGKL